MRFANARQSFFRISIAELTSQRQQTLCSECCYLDDGAGCELGRLRIRLTRNTQTVPSSLNSPSKLLIMVCPSIGRCSILFDLHSHPFTSFTPHDSPNLVPATICPTL